MLAKNINDWYNGCVIVKQAKASGKDHGLGLSQ